MDFAEVSLAVALTVAALDIVSYLSKGPSVIRAVYRSTPPGRRATLSRDLRRVSPGLQIDYVTEVLGQPAFKNSVGPYLEYIYVSRDAFVQVLTDVSGKIVLYAVTAKTAKFKCPTWLSYARWSPRPRVQDARLGRFSFGEVSSESAPSGVLGWLGARRFGYVESYYYGNPGNYLTYFLAVNDAGYVQQQDSLALLPQILPKYMVALGELAVHESDESPNDVEPEDPSELLDAWLQEPHVVEWRRISPNTFAVAGPNFPLRQLARAGTLPVGPDADQVRLLPKD